jgi:hypothetical protein
MRTILNALEEGVLPPTLTITRPSAIKLNP